MLSKIALLAGVTAAGSTEEWKKRTVYQLLTDRFSRGNTQDSACTNLKNYCGGNYKGLIQNLDYIKGMGFDAIWISPVVDNGDEAYHGYYSRDWTKTNDHFGSRQDLIDMVHAAHAKGMWVMVDVVANHVDLCGDDFSKIVPFNSPDHYHKKCQIVDWSNQWQVENCRLADLPDLDQSNAWVRQYLKDWIKDLV
jgi:alpha-amylase